MVFREKTVFFKKAFVFKAKSFFFTFFHIKRHDFLNCLCFFYVFAQGFPVKMQLFDQNIKTVALLARSCSNTFEQSICLLLMTMMILITIRHGALLAGWGSFEASNFS